MELSDFLYLNNEIKLGIYAYAVGSEWTDYSKISSFAAECCWNIKDNTLRSVLESLVKAGFLEKEQGQNLRKDEPIYKKSRYYRTAEKVECTNALAKYLIHTTTELGISIFPLIGQAEYVPTKRKHNSSRFLVISMLYNGATQTDYYRNHFSPGSLANHFSVLLREGILKEPSPLKYGDCKHYVLVEEKRDTLVDRLKGTRYETLGEITNGAPFTKNDIAAIFGTKKRTAGQMMRTLRQEGYLKDAIVWRHNQRFGLTEFGKEVYKRIVAPTVSFFEYGKEEESLKFKDLNEDKIILKNAFYNYFPYTSKQDRNSRTMGILSLIKSHGRLSQRRLSDLTGLSIPAVHYFISRLSDEEFIERSEKEKNYVYYRLTKKGRLAVNGTIKT
ncbi:MAG: winged helix-turn-helix domain-containing protein [Candidatus Woesearchaeota archaeon]